MGIQWNPRLAVGVASIDNQHKELFDRVNRLLTAMESKQGEPEVKRLVSFLGDYVVSHFGGEERLMQQHGYGGFADHKKQHDAFVKEFLGVKATIEKSGSSSELAVKLNHRICTWLLDHIGKTDKALGEFMAKKTARPAVGA